jgi:hypothetical protein
MSSLDSNEHISSNIQKAEESYWYHYKANGNTSIFISWSMWLILLSRSHIHEALNTQIYSLVQYTLLAA